MTGLVYISLSPRSRILTPRYLDTSLSRHKYPGPLEKSRHKKNEVAIWTVTVHLDFLRYMDCYSPYSRSTVDQLYGR